MTSTITTRLAHEVAPYPEPGPDIVRDMARYHASRAWGFWLTAQEPTSPRFAEVVQGLIAEFHLAAVWNHLHYVDRDLVDLEAADLAQGIVEDLAAPQVLGHAIRALCAAVGVDVKEIGPYMAGETVAVDDIAPASTPLSRAGRGPSDAGRGCCLQRMADRVHRVRDGRRREDPRAGRRAGGGTQAGRARRPGPPVRLIPLGVRVLAEG